MGQPALSDVRTEGSVAMRVLLLAALLVSLGALVLSWNLPLLEMHSFRQTQTAISAYWMAGSTDWLAYPTPILGAPWSIPFELPLFQGVVVAAHSLLPISFDQAGRLVSWLFALATLWPLRVCLLEASGNRRLADTCSVLFLLSPLYLFWSRAFLIESTALFLSMSFVALFALWLRQPGRAWVALLMPACAVLAALVKITTFFGFAVAAALWLLAHLARTRGQWSARAWLRLYAPVALGVAAAVVFTALWVRFSDAQKAETIWGSVIGSGNLDLWNFGNWGQRSGSELWRDVVFGRAARDTLGAAWLFPLAAIAALASKGQRWLALSALGLYLVPILVFTPLHMVHNYYQYANAVFLLVVLGCALEAIRARAGEVAGIASLLLCALLMLLGFRRDFLPAITGPLPATPTLEVAAYARAHTPPDSVLLVFGMDWSAEMPYYAQRRAMMVPDWIGTERVHRALTQPDAYRGGHRIGMIVACPNHLADQPETREDYLRLMREVERRTPPRLVAGCKIYR